MRVSLRFSYQDKVLRYTVRMKVSLSDLRQALRRTPRIGGAALCHALNDIDRSTLARLAAQLDQEIVRRGSARRTRYALRRTLRGSLQPIALYRIDAKGAGHTVGHLDLLYPEGSALDFAAPFPWPLDTGEMQDGWFDSLPYPVLDMRPQGFLGRNFAHRNWQSLGVPQQVDNWTDDDIVHALSEYGYDQSGDLILGDRAYQAHLDHRRDWESRLIAPGDLAARYGQLALAALSQGEVGSSAAGEFPKFTAMREIAGVPVSVIVKFSGADGSAAVQRWSDLLVCEHLALQTLAAHDIPAATSVIHQFTGRTFLEVVRFDRHGAHGRLPLCSLAMINAALLGKSGTAWPTLALAFARSKWLDDKSVERITRLWWFGKLIGNTDMHDGNLSFHPGLGVAPAYDMLPMQYAPLRGGEVPVVNFMPALPLPGEAQAWSWAADAAIAYWQHCARDARISDAFRQTCARNAEAVSRLRD